MLNVLEGENDDGHKYINSAIQRGARLIVDYAYTEDALESVLKTLTKCNYQKRAINYCPHI